MKIFVDVNTTKKDYMSFQKKHTYKSLWIYGVIIVLAAVVLFLALYMKNSTGKINPLFMTCFIFICAIFVYVLVNNIIKVIKSANKEANKPMFSYTFTKGGVHCESNGRSFDLPWTNVYCVAEAEDMFLVYVNKESALILPKRCFKSDADIDEFRSNFLFAPRKIAKQKPKK